jgi:hypothetical protein
MYILRPDEKTTPVMLYTHDTLVRGEAVKAKCFAPQHMVADRWRSKYIHILKAQVFGGVEGTLLFRTLFSHRGDRLTPLTL